MNLTGPREYVDVASSGWKARLSGSLFDSAPDAMIITDENFTILIANNKADELFNCADIYKRLLNAEELFPVLGLKALDCAIAKNESEQGVATLRATRLNNGGEFVARVEWTRMFVEGLCFYGLIIRDVTDEYCSRTLIENKCSDLRKEKEKLENLTQHDYLTELLNRRGMESVLTRELQNSKRKNLTLIAAIVDLDNFKLVNDRFGHFVGDQVLRHVSHILKTTVRTVDWVGRIGGDEFLLLLPETTLVQGVSIAERVRASLADTLLSTNDGDIQQTASFGLVALPDGICSIEEVLELTKVVLKQSKLRGKNCVYAEGVVNTGSDNQDSILDLACYRTVCQPIVDLKSLEVRGYECLTRGASGGLEMPNEFFRMARENNALAILDLHCLRLSLTRLAQMNGFGIGFINLHPLTLLEVPISKIVDQVNELKGEREICFDLSAKRIMADTKSLLEPVAQLRNAGIKISLDDVGFGNSSLESVVLLKPEFIKIDESLTRNISENASNRNCLEGLLKAFSHLTISVIAEGVETKRDLEDLKDLGIRLGQGFHFGLPR